MCDDGKKERKKRLPPSLCLLLCLFFVFFSLFFCVKSVYIKVLLVKSMFGTTCSTFLYNFWQKRDLLIVNFCVCVAAARNEENFDEKEENERKRHALREEEEEREDKQQRIHVEVWYGACESRRDPQGPSREKKLRPAE